MAIASDAALPPVLSSLFEQAGESDPEIHALQHQLEHAGRRILGLEEEVAGLKAAIELMMNSHSWKVTIRLRRGECATSRQRNRVEKSRRA